jgi:hypothetical protein
MTFFAPAAEVPPLVLAPSRPVGAEDVRDSRALRGTSRCYVGRELSKGLKTLRKVSLATWARGGCRRYPPSMAASL